jgi:deoxyribodipyrimidine photolyase-related protein
MAEASEESTHVFSNKHRIVYFISSMRHFRNHVKSLGLPIRYHQLDRSKKPTALADYLRDDIQKLKPIEVTVTKPGDCRVETTLSEVCRERGLKLDVRQDSHFLCKEKDFADHAENRKSLRLEFFYREMRRKHNVLMDAKTPLGGSWNYDKDNRESLPKSGPPHPTPSYRTTPNLLTQEVIQMVAKRFPDHPGNLSLFCWPVSPKQAEIHLNQFISSGLPLFGRFQDAMWLSEKTLFHSLIAAPLNLRLLDPLKVIRQVEKAYKEGDAPLAATEGFIRQVLGWREYIRGIYNLHMPLYAGSNFFRATQPIPSFFWTGETDMACMKSCLSQVLETGYGHHIQRLMVIGLYSLLRGVHPKEINAWFLASYVDAVDWVTTPNVIGMSQFADGGLMASKPYTATGAYINRMSNYCKSCQYNPKESVGPNACPFTTLYWSFLDRHRERLSTNHRMSMQLKNLQRLDEQKLTGIRKAADSLLHQSN